MTLSDNIRALDDIRMKIEEVGRWLGEMEGMDLEYDEYEAYKAFINVRNRYISIQTALKRKRKEYG